MLYTYLNNNYKNGEPIIISELVGYKKEYLRQELKRLADNNKIKRVQNGLYYLPYKTILDTEGKMNFSLYIKKRYLLKNNEINGYITGLSFANELGLTTQNPVVVEIASNEASTILRKITVDGRELIVYKPHYRISQENYRELQFLDLMNNIDKYSELSFEQSYKIIVKYLNSNTFQHIL